MICMIFILDPVTHYPYFIFNYRKCLFSSHPFCEQGNTSALMAWLFSLSVSKRGLYTTMSLLLCIFQLGLLVADVILHFVIKDNSFPSQHHTEAILVATSHLIIIIDRGFMKMEIFCLGIDIRLILRQSLIYIFLLSCFRW